MADKTKSGWINTSFRAYLIAAAIVVLVLALSFLRPKILFSQNDVSWAIAFAEVNGTIYALVAAFTILNALNKFKDIQDNVKKETTVLRDIYLMCGRFKQKTQLANLRRNIEKYIDSAVGELWGGKVSANKADRDFDSVLDSVDEFTPKDEKGIINAQSLDEQIMNLLDHRAEVTSSMQSKTPVILWLLLIELSVTLLFSFLIANYDTQILATLAPTSFSIAVALVIAVISDLDNPTVPGFWVINPDAYLDLKQFIKNH